MAPQNVRSILSFMLLLFKIINRENAPLKDVVNINVGSPGPCHNGTELNADNNPPEITGNKTPAIKANIPVTIWIPAKKSVNAPKSITNGNTKSKPPPITSATKSTSQEIPECFQLVNERQAVNGRINSKSTKTAPAIAIDTIALITAATTTVLFRPKNCNTTPIDTNAPESPPKNR